VKEELKMKMKSIILCVLILFTACSLFSQDRNKLRRGIPIQTRLNLTDEQRTQLEDFMKEYREENAKISEELKNAKAELKKLMAKKESNEATLLAKADEISQLQSKMLKARIRYQLKRKGIYTDEQWEKMQKGRNIFRGKKFMEGMNFNMRRNFRNQILMRNLKHFRTRFDCFPFRPFRMYPELRMNHQWWFDPGEEK